jgi:hypothetical protein
VVEAEASTVVLKAPRDRRVFLDRDRKNVERYSFLEEVWISVKKE